MPPAFCLMEDSAARLRILSRRVQKALHRLIPVAPRIRAHRRSTCQTVSQSLWLHEIAVDDQRPADCCPHRRPAAEIPRPNSGSDVPTPLMGGQHRSEGAPALCGPRFWAPRSDTSSLSEGFRRGRARIGWTEDARASTSTPVLECSPETECGSLATGRWDATIRHLPRAGGWRVRLAVSTGREHELSQQISARLPFRGSRRQSAHAAAIIGRRCR